MIVNLRKIFFSVGMVVVGLLFYDGLSAIMGQWFSDISPWFKVAFALFLAIIGIWKVG